MMENIITNSDVYTGWFVVGASVIGTYHEKKGQKCQDHYHWVKLNNDIFIATVADGAGSADFGDIGATVASHKAIETICLQSSIIEKFQDEKLLRLLIMEAFESALTEIESESISLGTTIRELATTLLLVIATPNMLAVGQIGDGAVVAGNEVGEIFTAIIPQRGEYANETSFLLYPDSLDTIQINIVQKHIDHIAMFSDGLQSLALKMPEYTPHTPFFYPLFNFISNNKNKVDMDSQIAEFLRSNRVRERTDDDLTLLLATYKGIHKH